MAAPYGTTGSVSLDGSGHGSLLIPAGARCLRLNALTNNDKRHYLVDYSDYGATLYKDKPEWLGCKGLVGQTLYLHGTAADAIEYEFLFYDDND